MSIQSKYIIEVLRVGEFQAGTVERVGYFPASSQIFFSFSTASSKSYAVEGCGRFAPRSVIDSMKQTPIFVGGK